MSKRDGTQEKKEKIHMKGKTEIKYAAPKHQKIHWKKKPEQRESQVTVCQ